MLSRVANIVYWMARYLERAENTARIVDVNAQLVIDLQSRQAADDPRSWEPLVYVTGDEDKFFELYGETVSERAVVEFMLFDKRNPSSVVSCISNARENARCVRDQLANDVWETINTFYLQLKDDDYSRYAQLGSAEYLNRLKTRIQLFYGVADSMLTRTQAWWFYEFGRYLERADNTSRILDVKYYMLLPSLHAVGSALDLIQWGSVLRSCSAFEAFRRTRRGQLTLERVLDYLIRDEDFPRSILFSVLAAEDALARIVAVMPHMAENPASTRVAQLRTHLQETRVADIINSGVHEYLDEIQEQAQNIHVALQATFVEYPASAAKALP